MSIGLAAVRNARSGLVRLYLCNFPRLARLLACLSYLTLLIRRQHALFVRLSPS